MTVIRTLLYSEVLYASIMEKITYCAENNIVPVTTTLNPGYGYEAFPIQVVVERGLIVYPHCEIHGRRINFFQPPNYKTHSTNRMSNLVVELFKF